MEETFDAAPAVQAILERHPTALVAVEERGVGYRVTKEFPVGELSGEMIVTDVEDLVAAPVSRVIIRDPDATADDFVTLAEELGLHGTDYVVGWTAWLDLAPVGVSKASGLAHVAERLGVDAADVLAIGDGRNDIEMLEWAGRGVAMGQAVQQVHGRRRRRHRPVADDGAASSWGGTSDGLPDVVDTERLRLPLWTAEDIAAAARRRAGRRLAPPLPARGRPRRGLDVATTATPGGRLDHARRRRPRLDRLLRSAAPAADGVPEAESATASSRTLAGAGVATEALTALLDAADAAGVRVRASVLPDNAPASACSPSAASPSCAAATRTASWSWPARCEVSLPRARRHRPRRHPGPLRRHHLRADPRGPRRGRGARRPGRVRDRPAAALGRGGLRRTSATTAWRSSPTARSSGTSRPTGPGCAARSTRRPCAWSAPSCAAAVPGSTFAVETARRDRARARVHRAAPGPRRRPPRAARRAAHRAGRQAAGPARGARARRTTGTPPRRRSATG